MEDNELQSTPSEQPAAESRQSEDAFLQLIEKEFKPKSAKAKEEVQKAVATLASQALLETAVISDDALATINAMVAELDLKLTAQINEILHNDRFQALEGSWRGLHHLVMNTETDEMLKIRFMSISKEELAKTLAKFDGVAWDQSPLFRRMYTEEYGQLGGHPFGCFVGDYYFDHSPKDVKLLQGMARVAAAAHAPFLAAAGPTLVNMDSWQEMPKVRDIKKIFSTPEYAAWKALRESEDSRYIALTLPRFLARLPYGSKTDPVEDFDFEEDASGTNADNYTWSNSAYAMAVNINRAFKDSGWCVRIRGVKTGGIVEGLPLHTFPSDDGGVDMKCPTEIAIDDRREKELSDCGFLPLIHKKNTTEAAFLGAQTLQLPKKFDDDDATANANLGARLPYIFAISRFAHYLKCIVRDNIGSSQTQAQLQKDLQDWIMQYVAGDPDNATEETKARKPLASAEVKVMPDEANPGYYNCSIHVRPHYQLEGMTIDLSLVSKLPSQREGA
ncbi:MAG TPA: type VI secretion system contractile sheath large subunit [Candidatus Binatia bacterium]|nr:type VI secretion system contractile sheath large subunit [Candidatus Binatia bacterium]